MTATLVTTTTTSLPRYRYQYGQVAVLEVYRNNFCHNYTTAIIATATAAAHVRLSIRSASALFFAPAQLKLFLYASSPPVRVAGVSMQLRFTHCLSVDSYSYESEI